MAEAYKRSSTVGGTSTTDFKTLYTVPSSKSSVISTISICNTAGAAGTYRIGLTSASGGLPPAADYLIYDGTVPANDTVFLTVGVCLEQNTYVRVASSASTVVFQAFISEIT